MGRPLIPLSITNDEREELNSWADACSRTAACKKDFTEH